MTGSLHRSGKAASFASAALFLFPAAALSIKPVAGLIELTILCGTLILWRDLWRERMSWLYPARWIIAAFALNFACAAASMLLSGFQLNQLDYPFRAALCVGATGCIVLTRPDGHRWWLGLFIGTVAVALFALYQRTVLDLPRAEGVHMAIMFGDLAMAMGLASLGAIPVYAGTRLAPLPCLAFAAACTASVLSGTRGAWIAAVLAFIPLCFSGSPSITRKTRGLALAGIIVAAAVYFLPEAGVNQRVHEAASDIGKFQTGETNTPVGTRLEMWKGAWLLFTEHPLTGIGHANFNAGLSELIRRGELDPAVGIYKHAHNEVLHALATKGLIGGAILMLLYAAPFVFFLRRLRADDADRPFAMAGLLIVLTYFVCGWTQVLSSHHIGTAFYAISVLALAGLCLSNRPADNGTPVKVQ